MSTYYALDGDKIFSFKKKVLGLCWPSAMIHLHVMYSSTSVFIQLSFRRAFSGISLLDLTIMWCEIITQ